MRNVSVRVYLTIPQMEQLRILNEKTRVPMAVYIRDGVDLILEKYKKQETDGKS